MFLKVDQMTLHYVFKNENMIEDCLFITALILINRILRATLHFAAEIHVFFKIKPLF